MVSLCFRSIFTWPIAFLLFLFNCFKILLASITTKFFAESCYVIYFPLNEFVKVLLYFEKYCIFINKATIEERRIENSLLYKEA